MHFAPIGQLGNNDASFMQEMLEDEAIIGHDLTNYRYGYRLQRCYNSTLSFISVGLCGIYFVGNLIVKNISL